MFLIRRNTKISTCSPLQTAIEKIKHVCPAFLQLQHFLTTNSETVPDATPRQEKGNSNHGEEEIKLPNKPTSAHYDELIAIAGRSRDLKKLKKLLNQRSMDRCFNTKKTFNFLAQYRDDEGLLWDMVKELTATLAKLAPGYGKKNAFDILIRSLCNFGHTCQAVFVIEEMFDGKHGPPSACTFYPLLAFYSKKREMEKLRALLRFMEEKGISPDLTCYNYELTSLCHLDRLSEAAELLEKMGKADSRTFNALVIAACRAGRVEGAMALVGRMEEDGVVARYSTNMLIIRKLLNLGGFYKTLEFVVGVSGRHSKIDAVNFGFLGKCLVKRKMVEEARLVLEEMENRGLSCREELARLLEDLET